MAAYTPLIMRIIRLRYTQGWSVFACGDNEWAIVSPDGDIVDRRFDANDNLAFAASWLGALRFHPEFLSSSPYL